MEDYFLQFTDKSFHGLDKTEHLKHQVSPGEGGVAWCVIRGGDLHQVTAHNVEARAAPDSDDHDGETWEIAYNWPDDLQRLDAGQAPDLRGPGAGTETGVNGVNIKAEVAGVVTNLGSDVSHQGL